MDSTHPRLFVLVRDEDVSGVSGTGIVAEGVEFSSGTVALKWTSDWPTSVVFHERGIESVRAIHGHAGRTRIVYRSPQPTLTDEERIAVEHCCDVIDAKAYGDSATLRRLLERTK